MRASLMRFLSSYIKIILFFYNKSSIFFRVSYESSSLPSPYLEISCLFSDGFFLSFHLLSYWVGQYDGELVVAVDSSSFETERFHGFSDVDGVEAATLKASVVEFPQEVARCEGFSLFAFFRSADEGEEGFLTIVGREELAIVLAD